jgi:hypothetical protein
VRRQLPHRAREQSASDACARRAGIDVEAEDVPALHVVGVGAEAHHPHRLARRAGHDDAAAGDQLRPPALEGLLLERVDDLVRDDPSVAGAPTAPEDRSQRGGVVGERLLERQCCVPSRRTTTR